MNKSGTNKVDDVEMTPMVDVSFLLLIFFVVTASFQLQRAVMVPKQLSDLPSPVAQPVQEDATPVQLHIDQAGGFLVVTDNSQQEPLGKQALVSALRQSRRSVTDRLLIKVENRARLQSLVDGMDSGSIAGYQNIQVNQVDFF